MRAWLHLAIPGLAFVVCGCLAGCQTGSKARELASTTSTNVTTVTASMSAFTQRQDRLYEFLDGNLQRTANAYNFQPNRVNATAASFQASGLSSLAAVLRSLYQDSETNAVNAFNAQALLQQADATALAQLQQRQALMSAWNSMSKDLTTLARKPTLNEQVQFIAGYAEGVYDLVQQKEAQAHGAATNAVQQTSASNKSANKP
jgi:hypothetical protein